MGSIYVGILLIIMIIVISTMKKLKRNGELFYQRWLMWLGIGTISYTLFLIYNLAVNYPSLKKFEIILSFSLIISFLFVSIVALLEYNFTKGEFGKYGIVYKTPWSGTKRYSWFNIIKVEYNPITNWYIFYMDDGEKMRFSSYLSGVDDLIEFTTAMGHDIEVIGKGCKLKTN